MLEKVLTTFLCCVSKISSTSVIPMFGWLIPDGGPNRYRFRPSWPKARAEKLAPAYACATVWPVWVSICNRPRLVCCSPLHEPDELNCGVLLVPLRYIQRPSGETAPVSLRPLYGFHPFKGRRPT